MIGIRIDFTPPTETEVPIDWNWWRRPRQLVCALPWIFDFFKNAISAELIEVDMYEAPEDEFNYNTKWADVFFSPNMESAQTWTTSSEFLQFLALFQSNGFTLTVTMLENVDPATFSLPMGYWTTSAQGDIFFGHEWGRIDETEWIQVNE